MIRVEQSVVHVSKRPYAVHRRGQRLPSRKDRTEQNRSARILDGCRDDETGIAPVVDFLSNTHLCEDGGFEVRDPNIFVILIFRLCQVTEDVESKVENSEEANSAKNLEYKTRKDADEPSMDVGYKTRKEVDEPTTDVEHKTRMDVDEPTTDVEHKTMNDMEELKLVKDVSEMKSKLNGLESKLSEAEVIISKLTEERRLNAQERESLRQELALLMSKRVV
ncbi:vesicle-associated protein 2-2-like [Camellia sinensis]|uniref:vesicle-associated protein 2-2-like n=1 Tax=Camellia sinensis TaxID=4442 RepID=UPI001036C644|nr:vesicle-associated protein 2-2-like [Camellia sinensis]